MVIMIKTFIKKNIITLTLAILLLVLSVVSLFIGAIDINIKNFFMDSQAMEVFVISRLPRLLAILCTGIGISVAGLIMQQLCMNKFVSPTTGATISSAQFGILLALILAPDATIWGRAIFAFVSAIFGTWIFVWFIQRIQYKDIVMVPLVGICIPPNNNKKDKYIVDLVYLFIGVIFVFKRRQR